ncbi:MAG: hypothetical protein H0W70_12360 [Actinobacteria bacterium]|nr:hypothetical protein [Actinomycetota bacterium]
MNRVVLITGLVLASAAAGVVATGSVISGLPVALALAVAGFLALVPVAFGRWIALTALLLGWLMLEDLFRKLAGNDVRLYFVKDAIFALVLISMVSDNGLRGKWRAATGSSRLWLYALIGWGVTRSFPPSSDFRTPLIGLRLDFLYVPLVIAGYAIASDRERLKRWWRGIAVLGAATGLVGVIQASIGPGFLAPSRDAPGLPFLNLVRGLPGQAEVFRPSGTFVDPGRFLAAMIVCLAIGLAAVIVRRRDRRATAAVAVMAAAVWVSGGRTGMLVATGLICVAAVAPSWAARRTSFVGIVRIVAIAAVALVTLPVVAPDLYTSRLAWYRDTLDPRSGRNEWSFLWTNYSSDTVRGIGIGGPVGNGTGTESLGRQYVYGGSERSTTGLNKVEGGWAAIAVEWGWVGLFLWVGWTISWLGRLRRCVRAARPSPFAAGGAVLLAIVFFDLVVGFFGGLQGFQNYIENAYFWLISGMILGLPALASGRASDAEGVGEALAVVE